MPASGGATDKIGNRYETLWAIDQLLRIVSGDAQSLTLEALELDESTGVEFSVSVNSCKEFWSVKRQTAHAAGWTLALLSARDRTGRSILGDLLGHVEPNAGARGVFASTQAATDFEELRAHTANREMLESRLSRSDALKAKFLHYVLALCGDKERARSFLQRTRTCAIDEQQLRERVHFTIRTLFYNSDNSPIDVSAVRGHLADLLLEQIHRPIDQGSVLEFLAKHGIRPRDWARERTVRDRFESICDAYQSPLTSELINGRFLPLTGSDLLLRVGTTPIGGSVLVVGGAGGGKSASLGNLVSRMRALNTPVVAIRFDQLPDGILSATELGQKLLLPESPAIVLAGVASGGPSVLVVDQLDSISLASGRRTGLWTVFDELRREASKYPGMALVVGCREFDLEHDPRMRRMKAEGGGFTVVTLQELSSIQVDAAKECPRHLKMDPIWCFRSYGDDHFELSSALLAGLAQALEALAQASPRDSIHSWSHT